MNDVPNHVAACIPHIQKLLVPTPRPREELIDYVAQGMHTGIADAKRIINHLTRIGLVEEFTVSNPDGSNTSHIASTNQLIGASGRSL